MRWQDAPLIEDAPPADTPKMRWQDAPLVEDAPQAAPAQAPAASSATHPPAAQQTRADPDTVNAPMSSATHPPASLASPPPVLGAPVPGLPRPWQPGDPDTVNAPVANPRAAQSTIRPLPEGYQQTRADPYAPIHGLQVELGGPVPQTVAELRGVQPPFVATPEEYARSQQAGQAFAQRTSNDSMAAITPPETPQPDGIASPPPVNPSALSIPEAFGKSVAVGTTDVLGGIVGGVAPFAGMDRTKMAIMGYSGAFSTLGLSLLAPKLYDWVNDIFPSLRGTQEKINVETKAQLRSASKWIKSRSPEQWRQEVAVIAGKDITWSAEGMTSLMANVTMQIPLVGATYVSRAAGGAVGGLVAGPVGAKIGAHMAGYAVMAAAEANQMYDACKALGLSEEVADKYAQIYGLGSGAIEYVQELGRLGALKGKSKAAIAKYGIRIFKKVVTALGGTVGEGLEELSQNTLQNYLLQRAVAEQKELDPTYTGIAPTLGEGGLKSFIIAATTGGLTRGAGAIRSAVTQAGPGAAPTGPQTPVQQTAGVVQGQVAGPQTPVQGAAPLSTKTVLATRGGGFTGQVQATGQIAPVSLDQVSSESPTDKESLSVAPVVRESRIPAEKPVPAVSKMETTAEKAIEPAGKPIELYHGTRADFADADIATGQGLYGIHLTTDEAAAKDYGKVKKYELSADAKGLDLSDGYDLWTFMQKKRLLDEDQLANPDLKDRVLSGRLFQYDLDNNTHLADFVAQEVQEDGYDIVMLGDDLGGKGDNIAYVVVNNAVLNPIEPAPTAAPVAKAPQKAPTPAPKAEVAPEAAQGPSRVAPTPVKGQGRIDAATPFLDTSRRPSERRNRNLWDSGANIGMTGGELPLSTSQGIAREMMERGYAAGVAAAKDEQAQPDHVPDATKKVEPDKGPSRLSDAEKAAMQEEYAALRKRNIKANGDPRKNAKPEELKRIDELWKIADADAAIGRREAKLAKEKADKAWVEETNAQLGLKPGQTVTIVARDGHIKEQGKYLHPEKGDAGYGPRLFVKMQKGGTFMWSQKDIVEAKGQSSAPIKKSGTPDQIYDASRLAFRQSARDYDKIVKAYRTKEIGDDEFLAGKAAFAKAQGVFDKAETDYIEANNAEPATSPKQATEDKTLFAQPAAVEVKAEDAGVFGKAGRAAQERINVRSRGEKPTSGIDPAAFADWVLVGLDHAERIIRKLGKLTRRAWTAAMKAENPDLKPADARKIWSMMHKESGGRLVEIEKAVAKPVQIAPPARQEGPKLAPSKAAEWIEATAVEEGLQKQVGDIKLRQHEVMDMKEQARMVAAMSYEQAERIALGEETPPAGLRVGSVFVAVGKKAVMDGNYDLVTKLATSEALDVGTRAGQEAKAFDARDPYDPVQAIRHIIKASRDAVERRQGGINPKVAADLEAKLSDANKALDNALAAATESEKLRLIAEADAEMAREWLEGGMKLPKAELGVRHVTKEQIAQADADILRLLPTLRKTSGESSVKYPKTDAMTVKGEASGKPGPTQQIIDALANKAIDYIDGGGNSGMEWAKQIRDQFHQQVPGSILKRAWASAAGRLQKAGATKTTKAKLAKQGSITQKDVRDLYRAAITEGIKGLDARLDYVHDALKEIDPKISREEVRDIFTGYGQASIPNQDALEVELRENAARHLLLSQLRDIAATGEMPPPTGFVRDEPSQAVRELRQDVADAKKKLPLSDEQKGAHLQSQKDTIVTRLKNEIADLDAQIAEGKRKVRDKSTIEYTATMKALVEARNTRKKVLDEIDPIDFKVEQTADQKRLDHLQKRLGEFVRKVFMGDVSTKTQPPAGAVVDTPAIAATKATIEDFKAKLAEMRTESGKYDRKVLRDAIAAGEKLLDKITSRDLAIERKTPGRTTPELEAVRKENANLRKILAQMRREAKPRPSEAERRLNNAMRHYERRDAQLRAKLERGDFEAERKASWQNFPDSPKKAAAIEAKRKADSVAAKLRAVKGLSLDPAQVKTIVDLAREAMKTFETMRAGERTEGNEAYNANEMAYGIAAVRFESYVADLQRAAETMTWAEFKTYSAGKKAIATTAVGLNVIVKTVNIGRSLMASMDNSAVLRQNLPGVTSDMEDLVWRALQVFGVKGHGGPTFIWIKYVGKSFKIIWDTWGGKNVSESVYAGMRGSKDYDAMKTGRLAIGGAEEANPGEHKWSTRAWRWATNPNQTPAKRLAKTILASPPIAYKASNDAFTVGTHYLRSQAFEREMAIGRRWGVNVDDPLIQKGLGRLVNTASSRGDMKESRLLTFVFWTPKMIKAHFDFLTMHLFTDAYRLSKGHFTKGQVADIMPAYVRARAAMQFAELAAGVAGMMMLLKALPDDVVEIELDPRSSDIGTAKVGNTRIDLTGGKKALITLAARLITRSSKSSTTGKVTDLTLGNFMSRTGEDFIMDAVSNKYSPVMGEFMQYMSGTQRYAPKIDGKRQKYSPAKGIARQFIPLSFTNAWELINDPDAAPFFAAVIAEGLGASTNTYPTSPPMTRYFRTEFSEWVEIPYKKAKAEDKPIPPKAEMNFRRMGKVNDLLNELDNEAEVQKTPSARVATIRARQEVMAASALANKPVFSAKFQPVNKDELKFAYSELWHARAEKTLTGKAWSAHRAALVAAGRGMKATGKLEKKALGTVKAWYTTRHGEALKAGDVDAARAYLDARVALGVKTRDIKKNISAWSMNDDLYDAAQNRKIMETFNKANK